MSFLEMKNITKSFPGVIALDSINFSADKGEVHAIVGENGAGKSTLIKILSGAYSPDSGEICLDGQKLDIRNPQIGRKSGVAVIYQELSLIPSLSVAENIFIGSLPKKGVFVNRKEMYERTKEAMKEIGSDIAPGRLVGTLSIAQQQIVEIAKVIIENSKIVIMDEPTALLPPKDVSALLEIVRKLRQKGVTVLYISHRLKEIFDIADRVTVFKDGRSVGMCNIQDVDEAKLVSMMIGRELSGESFWSKERAEMLKNAPIVLKVDDFKARGLSPEGVSFHLKQGEILGIAGLVGSGKSEIIQALFGGIQPKSGSVELFGNNVTKITTGESLKNHMGFLPADRKNTGLNLINNIRENISITNLKSICKFGLLNKKIERNKTKQLADKLRIKYSTIEQLVSTLSGGNQQKVVMAKWLMPNSKILMFDEPTRGVDVGARREIYTLMLDFCKQGGSIIMASGDIVELLGLCDRILVMGSGKFSGEFSHEEATENAVVAAMF